MNCSKQIYFNLHFIEHYQCFFFLKTSIKVHINAKQTQTDVFQRHNQKEPGLNERKH